MFQKLIGAVAAVSFAACAQGAYVTNGDLETLDPGTPVFANWTNNGGTTLATQAIGGTNSARIGYNTGNAGNALNHNFSDPNDELSVFSLSFDFAASDPGSAAGARSLQLNLRTVLDGGNNRSINLRIVRGTQSGLGTVEVYDNATFRPILVDAVTFSTSESGDGFVVQNLRIDGDYTTVPAFTVTVGTQTSESVPYFHGPNDPTAGTTVTQLAFQSGNLATSAWSVVDNITVVPEPAAVGLLGAAGVLALRRRRSA